jgi:hypothetical protein
MDFGLEEESTYCNHSARCRDGAHSARGLSDGVAKHIKEVNVILWKKGRPTAEELQLMGEEI